MGVDFAVGSVLVVFICRVGFKLSYVLIDEDYCRLCFFWVSSWLYDLLVVFRVVFGLVLLVGVHFYRVG